MKIFHVSDRHGYYWPNVPNDIDLVVDTGDDLPDVVSRGSSSYAKSNGQRRWVEDNINRYKAWLGNKPYLHISGNHCWFEPTETLRANGINAVNIDNKFYEFESNGQKVSFYGFPYCKFIYGFNYTLDYGDMFVEIAKMKDKIGDDVPDIFLFHSPPKYILDERMHWGCEQLREFIFNLPKAPKYVLFGHCHGEPGIVEINDVKFVNSATVSRVIEI